MNALAVAAADQSILQTVLDFTSTLVESLAWPAALVVLLIRFRKAVTKVLDAVAGRVAKVERVKGPGFEAAWTPEAVEDVAREAGVDAAHDSGTPESSDSISVQLAKIKPAAGVIDAYLGIEKQLRRYLKNSGLKQTRLASPTVAFRRYSDAPERLKNVVSDLGQLRNAAAHGAGNISEESAIEYTRTATLVARELEELADQALDSED